MDTTTLEATTPAHMDTAARPALKAEEDDMMDEDAMESTISETKLFVNMMTEMPNRVDADSW